MKKMTRGHCACLVACQLLLACGKGGDGGDGSDTGDESTGETGDGETSDTGDTGEPVMVELDGAVAKGPFVLGSSIAVSTVDDEGAPTGDVFNTQTVDDLGRFTVAFEASGFVALEGLGFYYNEVSGQLSDAPLTLRAFYEISGDRGHGCGCGGRLGRRRSAEPDCQHRV